MNRGNGQTIKATEIQADVLCLPKVNVGEWMINQNAQNVSTLEVLSKIETKIAELDRKRLEQGSNYESDEEEK